MSQPGSFTPDATAIATRVIYELLGRRWVWPAITTTESVELDPWPNTIILQGRPVIEVHSVMQTFPDGMALPLEYTVENKHRVRLTKYSPMGVGSILNGDPSFYSSSLVTQHSLLDPRQVGQLYLSPIPPRRIAVTYTYGSPPPPEIAWAIDTYAHEIALAMSGSDECRLPEGVTSISRQGVSMTLMPSDSFLDAGRTGITEVDSMLRNFNPSRAKRPARVYSPTSPPARRTNTTQGP